MEDELYAALLKFHREVFLPDFQRIVQEATTRMVEAFRADMERMRAAIHAGRPPPGCPGDRP